MKNLYVFVLVCLFAACNNPNTVENDDLILRLPSVKPEEFIKEVESLASYEEQADYLNTIGKLDQELRKTLETAVQQFGFDSEQQKSATQELIATDIENLAKVEAFLQVHGYPAKILHGGDAPGIPWLVIHHASGGVAPRARNFKYVYQAYRSRDIDGGALSFYLNRMYDLKFGHRMQIKNPFREEFELDTLIRSLDLQNIRTEVDAEFEG